MFIKDYKRIFAIARVIKNLDPKKIIYKPTNIIKPDNVDEITFRAMMTVQGVEPGEDMVETISEVISIVCYSKNNEGIFDTDLLSYKNFKNRILNEPLMDMLGLYTQICSELRESELLWEKRFQSVRIEDEDYEQAGGHRMSQFNILNTIKSICQDFNCKYEEAWQMSYALTQTHSYSNATAAAIQDEMRKIKERKMLQKRA